MAMSKRIQVWFPEEILKQITARGGDLSESIRESLTRYYALINYERKQISGLFTPGELGMICDMSNGTYWTGGMIPLGILANCEDAEQMYYDKWETDRDELLAKLRSLNVTQEHALVDACERWWQAVGHGFNPPINQLLQ